MLFRGLVVLWCSINSFCSLCGVFLLESLGVVLSGGGMLCRVNLFGFYGSFFTEAFVFNLVVANFSRV